MESSQFPPGFTPVPEYDNAEGSIQHAVDANGVLYRRVIDQLLQFLSPAEKPYRTRLKEGHQINLSAPIYCLPCGDNIFRISVGGYECIATCVHCGHWGVVYSS